MNFHVSLQIYLMAYKNPAPMSVEENVFVVLHIMLLKYIGSLGLWTAADESRPKRPKKCKHQQARFWSLYYVHLLPSERKNHH